VKHAQTQRISKIVSQEAIPVYGRTLLVVLLPQAAPQLQIQHNVTIVLLITLNVFGVAIHAKI
jgi:hypothetical protein